MRISLVGSFSESDGYLGASKALRRQGAEVSFVPAHFYKSEFPDSHVEKIINELKSQAPDIVLWWRSETLDEQQLKSITESITSKHIMFSWDEPFSWEDKRIRVAPKCKFFDMVFSCCKSSMQDYLLHGTKKVFYCLPGFDTEVHRPDFSEQHECDISFVITNYYDESITLSPHLNRKTAIEYLLKRFPDRKIHIYGPEYIGNDFPENYQGWLPFNESRKVFSSSKINISTHIRPDGEGYLNERCFQILGSGGLLLVDNVKGLESVLHPDKECVVFDFRSLEDLGKEIEQILSDETWRKNVQIQGREKAMKSYTWDSWAETILKHVGEFDV